jgi:hypothetical protein
MAQVDRFSVLCSILKNHFGRSGVVTSKESYSPVPVVVTSALVVPVIVGRELAAENSSRFFRPALDISLAFLLESKRFKG